MSGRHASVKRYPGARARFVRVRDAYLALGLTMLATIGIRVSLGRLVKRLDPTIAALQAIVVRLCICAIFALVTAQAVAAGGFWFLLLPISILLSLFSLTLAGGFIWLWVRDGLDDFTEQAH